MPVRVQVDRHAVDKSCEIGAVIEIETAQKELVGLSTARVLGGDEAGDAVLLLADPGNGDGIEIGIADRSLRSGTGDPNLFECAAIDDDLI